MPGQDQSEIILYGATPRRDPTPLRMPTVDDLVRKTLSENTLDKWFIDEEEDGSWTIYGETDVLGPFEDYWQAREKLETLFDQDIETIGDLLIYQVAETEFYFKKTEDALTGLPEERGIFGPYRSLKEIRSVVEEVALNALIAEQAS